MVATYQLNESELTEQFLQGLKQTFKGKRVTISVQADVENKFSREAFEAKIRAAEASPVSYVFEGDEFEKFTEQMMAGEPVDAEVYKRINS